MTGSHEVRWRRLTALLEPFHEQAQATARRLSRSVEDGDDLYQETLLRAFDRLPGLRDEKRFRSWFYAILLNRHRNRSKEAFWRRFLPWNEAFSKGEEPAAFDDAGSREAGRAVEALAKLPDEQREAIVLFELDGYSLEEVARLTGASIPAVKSRLVRGRERLRLHYERHSAAPLRLSPRPERERP
jgi:RNA polymerase sigma-70 factor (ECF subfamily)